MTDIIAEQDSKLSLISSYVSQLKNSAIVIGDTLDDHNTQLDNLRDDMDNTTERLNNTTNKIAKLNQATSSNFCLITTLLIVINVALCVIYFSI